MVYNVLGYRLSAIKDLVLGKQLMSVLLKLFGFAVNVEANRQELIKPEMNTINIMLGALNMVSYLNVGCKHPSFLSQMVHIQCVDWFF